MFFRGLGKQLAKFVHFLGQCKVVRSWSTHPPAGRACPGQSDT